MARSERDSAGAADGSQRRGEGTLEHLGRGETSNAIQFHRYGGLAGAATAPHAGVSAAAGGRRGTAERP
jgi:hypothetical protein